MCGLLVFISDAGTAATSGTRSRPRWRACTTAARTTPAWWSSTGDVIFAHKRLSIIDVEFSHEPMPYPPTAATRAATCRRSTARSTTTSSCATS